MLIASQPVTDATEAQLQGFVYFGTLLPYYSAVKSVVLAEDGSFALNIVGENPVVLATNLGANTSFRDTIHFSADGTRLDAAPAAMSGPTITAGGNSASVNALDGTRTPLLDLGDMLASAGVSSNPGAAPQVVLTLTAGESRATASFTPTGEPSFGILPAQPASIALAQAGDNVLLIYQDQASRDVLARLFSRDATQIGAEFTIGGTDNVAFNRAVEDSVHALTLDSGTIVVTWSNRRDGVDADPELFQALLNPDGSLLRGPEVVNTDLTGGTQYDGRIFALSDGGYAILYHTLGGSPYRQEAVVRQYDADGTPVGGSTTFEDQTEGRSLNAHFGAIFPNGFAYMIDGLETEFTAVIEGQPAPINQPPTPPVVETGTGGADSLLGGAGNDTLSGGGGNDTIDGGPGHDRINGGIGFDSLDGGAGDDVILGLGGFDTLNGGAGHDTLEGNAGNDVLNGGDGDDELQGGLGFDLLNGDAGDDLIVGRDGFDTLNGGTGADTLQGNNGNDLIFGGDDTDRLEGGLGSDTLQGDGGDDLLFGGNGFDLLFGGAGDDRLEGNSGNDTLDGGAGADVLKGGLGVDTFVFGVGYGADRIADFQNNIDAIHLDADLLGGGTPVPADLIQYAVRTAEGFLILDFGNGDTLTFTGVTNTGAILDEVVFV
ncbi:calcium-binding protein [Lacimonas salitolerans]|uniref:Calcium-binding protein n=1 Tax=Lacimonas salitolerans TaxID=1323750 RepID=A0ABW4EE23_9RHOB